MLDDNYKVCDEIYTGKELCHASGDNEKELCLAAVLLYLGFAGVSVERIEQNLKATQ